MKLLIKEKKIFELIIRIMFFGIYLCVYGVCSKIIWYFIKSWDILLGKNLLFLSKYNSLKILIWIILEYEKMLYNIKEGIKCSVN